VPAPTGGVHFVLGKVGDAELREQDVVHHELARELARRAREDDLRRISHDLHRPAGRERREEEA
jgi:hypothetical protein